MCEPATIIAGIGVAVSAAGAAYSASQQASAANAAKQANFQNTIASDNAFWARNANARSELEQEGTAQRAALSAQDQAFQSQRESQSRALDERDKVVQAENASAEDIRSQADAQQGKLLQATSGPALAEAQTADQAGRVQAFAPIAQDIQTTSPFAGDNSPDNTKRAFASRLAEAADAVRSYGKKVAQVASYTAPLNTVQREGTQENTGLMPVAAANQLLQSGQSIRLLPSQQAYQIAGSEGELTRGAIGSTLQNEMNVLKNRYSGQESVIDLGLGNQTAINNNRATAAASDAAAAQSVGQLISTVGNLAAYGSQRFSGGTTAQPSADALLGATGTGSVIGARAGVPFANLPGASNTFSVIR